MQNDFPAYRRYGADEDLEESLIPKISRLKQITITLNQDIKDSNKVLNALDTDFDKSKSFLELTIGRVGKLAKSGSWKLYLYLILFCLFVFTVLYLIIKWFR